MTVKKKTTQVIRWVTHRDTGGPRPVRGRNPSHRDPTADAAIGNIMREEKRRKKAGSRKGAERGKN